MLKTIYARKHRIGDFIADSIKGFSLIWGTARKLTVINLALFILQAVFPLLALVILKNLIDKIIATGNIEWQWAGKYLLGFASLQFVSMVLGQFSSYYMSLQQQAVSDDIAVKVLQKAVRLDLEYYENPEYYDELHMAQQQSLYRPAQFISACQGVLQNFISIILFSGFLFMVHWSVPLLFVALSIPLAISKVLHGYQQFLLDKDCQPAQRKAGSLFVYLTTDDYAKEVRVFNFGGQFIRQFLHLKQHVFTKKKQLHYKFLRQSILIQLFEVLITVLIYCILIAGAIKGTVTIGGLVIYFQVFQRLQATINGFFQSAINLFQHQLYLRQILNYLSTPPAVKRSALQLPMPALTSGIHIQDLNFQYPLTERQVLREVSMELKPGTVTAIVGENGSGKSTLIKLLCGLYNMQPGAITMDSTDIVDIAPEELREHVTAIFQDFGKYYLTIEENITLGSEKDEQKLKEASNRSGLLPLVAKMPQGYKTVLGRTFRNGEQLSGGQWQKLALARGFYKDSKIVILDEPTSAMDPVAEYEVFKKLKEDIGNKIVILVTHRLYNLKIADHIYVLKDGRMAENGSFGELLSLGGLFSAIYEKQGL